MALAVSLGACGRDDPTSITNPPATSGDASSAEGDAAFPEILDVAVEPVGGDEFDFSVTISSPYDSPDRYADAWRILDEVGTELGIRVLTHDHATEQPFTRSAVVDIPDGLQVVVVQARDLINGWGDQRVRVDLPGR